MSSGMFSGSIALERLRRDRHRSRHSHVPCKKTWPATHLRAHHRPRSNARDVRATNLQYSWRDRHLGAFRNQAWMVGGEGMKVVHSLAVSGVGVEALFSLTIMKTIAPTATNRLISCDVESPVIVVKPHRSPRGSSRMNSIEKRTIE